MPPGISIWPAANTCCGRDCLRPTSATYKPEAPPQGPRDYPRRGYGWDECPPEVVLTRMAVKDGRIVLPDGMSYRVLVLPDSQTMTPQLLRKVKELVAGRRHRDRTETRHVTEPDRLPGLRRRDRRVSARSCGATATGRA